MSHENNLLANQPSESERLHEVGIEEPEIDAQSSLLNQVTLFASAASVQRRARVAAPRELSEDELASRRGEAETELVEPGRWGTTFTLIQSWAARRLRGSA